MTPNLVPTLTLAGVFILIVGSSAYLAYRDMLTSDENPYAPDDNPHTADYDKNVSEPQTDLHEDGDPGAPPRQSVYVIGTDAQDDYYKIGRSTNPQARADKLATGNPYRMEVIVSIGPMPQVHARRLEGRLHERFDEERDRREWFELSEEQLRWLEDYELPERSWS